MGVEFPVRFPPEVRFGDAPGAPWTLLGDAPGWNNGDGPPLPTGDPVEIEEVRFGDAPGGNNGDGPPLPTGEPVGIEEVRFGDAPGGNNGDGPPLPTGDPVGIEESNRITTDKDFEGGPCFSEGPVCLLFGKVPTSRPLILHTHKLVIYGKHVTTGNVFRITDLFPPERLR